MFAWKRNTLPETSRKSPLSQVFIFRGVSGRVLNASTIQTIHVWVWSWTVYILAPWKQQGNFYPFSHVTKMWMTFDRVCFMANGHDKRHATVSDLTFSTMGTSNISTTPMNLGKHGQPQQFQKMIDTLPETNSSPLTQIHLPVPSTFRCELLVSGRVNTVDGRNPAPVDR